MRVDGSYRLRLALNSNLLLDDAPTRLGQTAWVEHRLRLSPKIVQEEQGEVQASFDVLSGLVFGDLAPSFQGLGFTERSERNGVHATGFDFRHLFAKLRLPSGVVAFGQMPNDWGMGMLVNGGNAEDSADFGDARFGDIVDRILFATRPLGFLGPASELAKQVSLALAGDLIYRDRWGHLVERNGGGVQFADVAWQAVGMLIWAPAEASRLGLYVARRIQSYAGDGGDLHVWTFDAHARTLLAPSFLRGGTISLEAEAAEIYGGTSHAPTLSALGSRRVAQQGAAARAVYGKGSLEAELEGGYASGDANPFDGGASAFHMSRDFKVGLVLFDEVLLFLSQNGARRLADPRIFGRPLLGADILPTEGAVTNAIYLKPTLRLRPAALGGRVRFVLSALFARAPAPVIDPYQAFATSAALNAFGASAGRNYGAELDAAVGYRSRLGGAFGLEVGAQAGVLFPGNAFLRADGSKLGASLASKLRATLMF